MAHVVRQLTVQGIEKALREPRDKVRKLPDGMGLYLYIARTGAAHWVLHIGIDGKPREFGLGSYPAVGLAEARDKASELRGKIRKEGIDPVAEKREAKLARKHRITTALSFRDCTLAYIKVHSKDWKNAAYLKLWTQSMERHIHPAIGDVLVRDVVMSHMVTALEPIWRKYPTMADHMRRQIGLVLDWSMAAELRPEGVNPATQRKRIIKLLGSQEKAKQARRAALGRTGEHFEALPYDDMPAFIQKLHRREGCSADALKFAVLTAVRPSEAAGAKWTEVDFAKKTWTVEKQRMKKEEHGNHQVPLSEAALAIVTYRHSIRSGDYVFPGQDPNRPLGRAALLRLIRRMGYPVITVHGFRSVFCDWIGDKTSFDSALAEFALAHVKGGTEGAYRRGNAYEKRALMMEAWSCYVCGLDTDDDTVVPLPITRHSA